MPRTIIETVGAIVGGIFAAMLILMGVALMCRALLAALDVIVPDSRPAIVMTKADFPLCVTVKPGPLLRSPQGKVDYRLGEPFNDRGTS